MRFTRSLAVILIIGSFCLALVFSYQNKDHTAVVRFGSRTSEPLPVLFIILGAFFVGVVFTAMIGIIEDMKLRSGNSRLKRKIAKLQAEVDALRNLPLTGPTDEPHSPVSEIADEDSAF